MSIAGVSVDPLGFLLFCLVFPVLGTVPLSLVLLSRYRAGVRRAMLDSGQSRGSSLPAPPTPPRRRSSLPQPPAGPMRISFLDAASALSPLAEDRQLLRRAVSLPKRAGMVYAAAGAVHALIASALWFQATDIEVSLPRLSVVAIVFAWPVVPTVVLVAVANRRLKFAGPLLFFALAAVVSWGELDRFAVFWLLQAAVPSVGLWILGSSRLRTVGPFVFLGLFAVALGATLAFFAGAGVTVSTGSGTLGLATGGALLVLLPALAWMSVVFVARRYTRKRTSDQSLLIDAWWLLYTLWQCFPLALEWGLLGLSGLAAFLAYELVLAVGFRRLHAAARAEPPARLLLLRTFGSVSRSERLLRELSLYWRRIGSLQLIAGTDLATANLEPHEFLTFLRGRLRSLFIARPQDLVQAMADLDNRPDPDGRFRVNEFFCSDDMWRSALGRLVGSSDVVLMDVRGFTRHNSGVVYELEQLVEVVRAERTILIVDDQTDRAFLHVVLAGAWERMSPASPNRGPGSGELQVLQIATQTPGEVRALLVLLCAAATSAPVRPSADHSWVPLPVPELSRSRSWPVTG